MRKLFINILVITIFSAITGVSTAIYSIRNVGESASYMLSNGPWLVHPVMDLKDARQKALIAMVGLFALRETEAIYYTATTDSQGNPLSSDSDYIMEGSIPEARYWSYTIYGEDDFLIPNEQKIYGLNQKTISYTPPESSHPEVATSLS